MFKDRKVMKITKIFSLLLFCLLSATTAWADEYDDALASITDGNYRIYTEVGGTKYYLKVDVKSPTKNEGNFVFTTATADEAATFAVSQVEQSGLKSKSWLIANGDWAFTNADGGNANDASFSAGTCLRGFKYGNRKANQQQFDRQVLYLKDGKLAVRCTNNNGVAWGSSAYWGIDADNNACYVAAADYIWNFEKVEEPVLDVTKAYTIDGVEGRYAVILGADKAYVQNLATGQYLNSSKELVDDATQVDIANLKFTEAGYIATTDVAVQAGKKYYIRNLTTDSRFIKYLAGKDDEGNLLFGGEEFRESYTLEATAEAGMFYVKNTTTGFYVVPENENSNGGQWTVSAEPSPVKISNDIMNTDIDKSDKTSIFYVFGEKMMNSYGAKNNSLHITQPVKNYESNNDNGSRWYFLPSTEEDILEYTINGIPEGWTVTFGGQQHPVTDGKVEGVRAETTVALTPATGMRVDVIKAGDLSLEKQGDGTWTFVMPAADVTLTVTYDNSFEVIVPAKSYVTYYNADSNIKLRNDIEQNAQLLTITAVNGETVTVKELTVVAKETPMLIYNDDDEQKAIVLDPTTDAADAVTVASEFRGTAEAKEMPGRTPTTDYYVLTAENVFAWVYEAGTVPANTCWLEITAMPAAVRTLTIAFDSTVTGVNEVQGSVTKVQGEYYDLQGCRIVHPTRGLYIVNGRKVVIK